MRRAITSTLLTRLHQSLGPLGASSAAAGAAANSLPLLSAASETSRAASSSSSTAGPLVGVCVLERLPVSMERKMALRVRRGARGHRARPGQQIGATTSPRVFFFFSSPCPNLIISKSFPRAPFPFVR